MPTLYQQAEKNIRKTWLLITTFLLLIIGLGWFFSYQLNSSAILIGAVIFSSLMSFLSYWYSDKIILWTSRAHPISKRDYPELYRIVENLCLTAGLPLPKIYVIEEMAPNAFATGRDPAHSAIAVTQGLLQKLEKTELEGVIAHELSHIKNRDILLSSVIVVLVGFVALLSDWFIRWHWWFGRRRDENNQLAGIMSLIGLVLAILAPLIAKLIQLAISRQREFLADASGALLTRYPEGLARALEKIARDPLPVKSANSATAHLYFASPFKGKSLAKLFMTHPPVEERIKALRQMNLP